MSHCSAGRAPLPLHKSGDGSPCVLQAGEPQTAQKDEADEMKAAAPSDSLEAGDMAERAQRGVAQRGRARDTRPRSARRREW